MIKHSNPYWYKLIKLFKSLDEPYKITTGLTIPFLFGAYKILDFPCENIDSLVKSIIEIEIDKYPIIQRCPNIGKHVVLVEEKSICNKEFLKYPRIKISDYPGILLVSTNSDIGKTYEKLCFSLKHEYQEIINRKEYSWDNKNKKWCQFDEIEMEHIRSLKKTSNEILKKVYLSTGYQNIT